MEDFLFDADSALDALINEGIHEDEDTDFDTFLKSSTDY